MDLMNTLPWSLHLSHKMDKARQKLHAIIHAWRMDVPTEDLYEIIIDWVNEYKHLSKNRDLMTEILTRTDIEEVVKDFVYGKYTSIRLEFSLQRS